MMLFDNRERQRQRIYAHNYTQNRNRPFSNLAIDKTAPSPLTEKACSWCNLTNVYGMFMWISPVNAPVTSHGLCKPCYNKEINKLTIQTMEG